MDTQAPSDKSIEDVLQLLRDLRYTVSAFQGNIEAFFGDNEDWQGIKSRLVIFEARFASMEVRLSEPGVPWQAEQIDYMLKELTEIASDISGIRKTFLETVEQVSQRVM